MSFEVEGLEEWKQELLKITNETFPNEKQRELQKIGHMAEREIKQFIPVDTGRLRASLNTQLLDKNTAQVGVDTDYAIDVNNGHLVNQRFLPAKYLDTPAGRKYLKNGNDKGIMLHPQYILGKHFMEKGMQNAEPKIMLELNSWLDELLRRLGE
ncbi:HK97 gp10 family phage protein [Clostridium sp. JN-9]|uniref:HK97 gp10 family phage protein n=1 Tax=Clostridium sp. JN-9 TaxID=2507159 RepID=UPI000FFE22DF|nr:HK97 gp10 family phage protein [Clostridium sp. JN-9]QAT40838.1 HK97 gp10 family phage protein [Clostridium sp. JN-9]